MYEQEKETIELGIIGAGGMGRFYAQTMSKAGWKKYSFTKYMIHNGRIDSTNNTVAFLTVLISVIFPRNMRA